MTNHGQINVSNSPLTEALKSLVISLQEYTTSGGRAIFNPEIPWNKIMEKAKYFLPFSKERSVKFPSADQPSGE